jgi:hypothetical protein
MDTRARLICTRTASEKRRAINATTRAHHALATLARDTRKTAACGQRQHLDAHEFNASRHARNFTKPSW